jgi:hypothetical protein
MKAHEPFPNRNYALAAALAIAALVLALAIAETAGGESLPSGVAWAPWRGFLLTADQALARGDATAARLALQEALRAALASRRWDAMLEVGYAARRAGNLPAARQAWLTALMRARHASAVEGLLGAADAFASIGDREVADQCMSAARDLANRSGFVRMGPTPVAAEPATRGP